MNRIAVLIPVFSNQRGLDRTLMSLETALRCFDVVVVDDGSPEAIHISETLHEALPIRLIRLDANQGISGALNRGLEWLLSRNYAYLARLDAGDTVSRERFIRQAEFLDANTDCGAVSSFVDFVDENRQKLFRYRAPCHHLAILRQFHLNNCLIHSGSMIRASALLEVGIYREDVPGAEDFELFLRISRKFKLAVIPEVLTICEYSRKGLSVRGRRIQQRERLKLQLAYFDFLSPFSFYGVARTLLAMIVPHAPVLKLKSLCMR